MLLSYFVVLDYNIIEIPSEITQKDVKSYIKPISENHDRVYMEGVCSRAIDRRAERDDV